MNEKYAVNIYRKKEFSGPYHPGKQLKWIIFFDLFIFLNKLAVILLQVKHAFGLLNVQYKLHNFNEIKFFKLYIHSTEPYNCFSGPTFPLLTCMRYPWP